MKTVLISGMSGNAGGMESFIKNMIKSLEGDDYRFDFIATDRPIAYQDEIERIGSIYWVTPRIRSVAAHVREIDEILKATSYDALWMNATTLSNIDILRLARRRKVPVRIVHSHASSNLGSRFTLAMHLLNRGCARRLATALVACSPSAARWFYGRHSGEATLLENSIDFDEYRYSTKKRLRFRESLGLKDEPLVGHVGRLSEVKNHKFLFDVFKEILKIDQRARLLLCGDGELRAELEDRAKKNEILDKVFFAGLCDDVPGALSAMDVMVFPSLHEGAPFALVEAQAASLPCLVSDTVEVKVLDPDLVETESLMEAPSVWAIKAVSSMGERSRSPMRGLGDCSLVYLRESVLGLLEGR